MTAGNVAEVPGASFQPLQNHLCKKQLPPPLPFASHILPSVDSPNGRGDREVEAAGIWGPGHTRSSRAGARVGGAAPHSGHEFPRGFRGHPLRVERCVRAWRKGGTRAKNTKASTVSHLAAERAAAAAAAASRCPPLPLHRRIIQLQNPPHSCGCASKQATKVHSPILLSSITSSFAFLQLFSPLSSLFFFFLFWLAPRLSLSLSLFQNWSLCFLNHQHLRVTARLPRRHPALPPGTPTKFPGGDQREFWG